MSKVKREWIEAATERLAKKCGKEYGDPWYKVGVENRSRVGVWQLDHNSVYGGYVIEETCNDAGAVTRPLGDTRLSGPDMLEALRMAERAVDLVSRRAQEA
jgi:hypothetical protein